MSDLYSSALMINFCALGHPLCICGYILFCSNNSIGFYFSSFVPKLCISPLPCSKFRLCNTDIMKDSFPFLYCKYFDFVIWWNVKNCFILET